MLNIVGNHSLAMLMAYNSEVEIFLQKQFRTAKRKEAWPFTDKRKHVADYLYKSEFPLLLRSSMFVSVLSYMVWHLKQMNRVLPLCVARNQKVNGGSELEGLLRIATTSVGMKSIDKKCKNEMALLVKIRNAIVHNGLKLRPSDLLRCKKIHEEIGKYQGILIDEKEGSFSIDSTAVPEMLEFARVTLSQLYMSEMERDGEWHNRDMLRWLSNKSLDAEDPYRP